MDAPERGHKDTSSALTDATRSPHLHSCDARSPMEQSKSAGDLKGLRLGSSRFRPGRRMRLATFWRTVPIDEAGGLRY